MPRIEKVWIRNRGLLYQGETIRMADGDLMQVERVTECSATVRSSKKDKYVIHDRLHDKTAEFFHERRATTISARSEVDVLRFPELMTTKGAR